MSKLKKSGFIEGAFIATFCIIIAKVLGIIYVSTKKICLEVTFELDAEKLK